MLCTRHAMLRCAQRGLRPLAFTPDFISSVASCVCVCLRLNSPKERRSYLVPRGRESAEALAAIMGLMWLPTYLPFPLPPGDQTCLLLSFSPQHSKPTPREAQTYIFGPAPILQKSTWVLREVILLMKTSVSSASHARQPQLLPHSPGGPTGSSCSFQLDENSFQPCVSHAQENSGHTHTHTTAWCA